MSKFQTSDQQIILAVQRAVKYPSDTLKYSRKCFYTMDPKTLLRSFLQLLNVIRIAGFEGLSLYFLSSAFGMLVMSIGVHGCIPNPEYNGAYLWIVTTMGIGFFIVSVYYIFHPCVWLQSINKHIALAPTDIHIPFFSTHPLYVFIDALFFIPAIALFQSGRAETMCQLKSEWGMGWALLVLAFFFPIFRVFSWYILNRKIEAMTLKKSPWMPVAWWYILALPLTILITYTYLDRQVFPRLRVPVVNEKTFEGGLDQHPEFLGTIVRVQGTLEREIAKCGLFGKDPEKIPYPYATILLGMGKKNGQIMVHVNRSSEVEILEAEAANKKDQIFEAFGILSKLPNPQKRMICGIAKAKSDQTGGLALLEVEMP